MTISAYARHRGVSRQAVHLALRAGRIVREPDGRIDAAKADAAWAANTAPRWSSSVDVTLSAAELEKILAG